MLGTKEEYIKEQNQKNNSKYCYDEAKGIWEKVKEAYSKDSKNQLYVMYSEESIFTFHVGDSEDAVDVLMDEEVDMYGKDLVVMPIQFQELYYVEPRYSDEYVRYQLGKKLETYLSKKSIR